MPFVSEAQRKWMWANKPKMARRWQRHTPKGAKLPAKAAALSDDVRGEKWDKYVELLPVYSDLAGGILLFASIHYKGKLIGSVGFSPAGAEGEKKLYPELVHVDPEWRRQGVASALYRAVQKQGYKILPGAQTKEGRKFRAQFDGKVSPNLIVQLLKEVGIAAAVVGGAVLLTIYGAKGFDVASKIIAKHGGRLVKWATRAMSLSHDDVSRTYSGNGYQMFQKWMQGHPTLKGTPVIRTGEESVRVDMPSRLAADEQGRSLFWHAVDNLARRTGVTREMHGPNRVKTPVNRFDEHDKDLLGRRYGKRDNETYRGRTIMRVYAPDDYVAKALEKELQSEDFDVRVSGQLHDPDKAKTRQSMLPQAKKPVIMLLVQVKTDQEYKRLNAIMSKWGLGKLGPGHARTIMSFALPVPTDPHRRESFGIHLSILFQHPNAYENLVTSMSKLGHQDHFRLENFGKRRAVLHATMPSRLGDVPGHTHKNFIEFLKTLVQDAGGSVTKVTDSTAANSFSSVDAFVSAKPDPSPFLDARRKALLRKRLDGGEAPGQGISGPQGPPGAMSSGHSNAVLHRGKGIVSVNWHDTPNDPPGLLAQMVEDAPSHGIKISKGYGVKSKLRTVQFTGPYAKMALFFKGHGQDLQEIGLGFAMDFTGEGQLTKRELARRVAQQLDIPATRVAPVVARALDHIALELMAGKRVELRNFGVFEMRLAKRKKSVLPNGNIQYSPERWYVHFQPSKRIHDARPGFPGKFKDADEEAPFSMAYKPENFGLHFAIKFDDKSSWVKFRETIHRTYPDKDFDYAPASSGWIELHFNVPKGMTSEKLETDIRHLARAYNAQVGRVTNSTVNNSFSMAQEQPVTPVTTPPMRQKVSVDFPDERRARAYASALLRDVPGANVHVNSTRVRVDHADEDGEKVHSIAAQHSKLARRASRRAVYLRRRQVQMAIDAAKAKTPEQAQPYQGPVPDVAPQQARSTADNSTAPSRQRLYFEGYDLAQEAADWYSKHGVEVKHREGDQIMVVHGPRKTVNEGIKRYKGSPMQVRCSESELRVEMKFPNKKLAQQAVHWLTLIKIRSSWQGGAGAVAMVPQSKWDHVYEQLNDIKFGPPKITITAEPGRGAPGGIPRGGVADPEETQHQRNKYDRAKGAGNKFLQYVIDFGSIVVVEKAKQALQRQGIDVEQEGSVLGVGLRAVAEAALTKVVEAMRGKILKKSTGGNGHAPNPHGFVHPEFKDKYQQAPMTPPPVKDLPHVKKNTAKNRSDYRKKHGEPSSVPGFSMGLFSGLLAKASIAVAAPLAKAAIKHLKDMGAKVLATKVVVTPGTVGKVIVIFEGTRQIIKDARSLLAPDAPRGASAKMGIDQVAVAYAVMDFISSEATRMIADYLAQKGIELVTKGSKHLVAKVKEADWAGLQAKVKEAHGRLKRMRSNKVDAASFILPAVPAAVVWGVYIIEGIAGALTAAVAVKELQKQGLAAKETERGVIVKGPEDKVEKAARKVRGRVRRLKKVPAASMGVGTMLKDPVFYKMLFFFGSAAAQAAFMLWVQARAVRAMAVGSHYVWVQFRSDIMGDVRAAVKKFGGVFKKRAKEKPEASLALSPDEVNNEKAAHIAGHQKQIEKLREKIKEARAKGDHATANGHAERLQKHQDTLDVLTGKGGQQRRPGPQPEPFRREGSRPFTQANWKQYTENADRAARQGAERAEQFRRYKRAQKINMWVNIGIWGVILAPMLIQAGIQVVQKGKEWYAKVTSPKEKEQVEEAVKKAKAKKQKATSHAAV